jgi:hypothetical protein
MSWPAAVSGAVTQISAAVTEEFIPALPATDRVKTLIPAASPEQVSDSPGPLRPPLSRPMPLDT